MSTMASRTCSVDGCERSHKARGWCGAHYGRWRFHGSPDVNLQDVTPESRFWAKVDKNGPISEPRFGPCWIWIGVRNSEGYGQLWFKSQHTYAHRFSYELNTGPIPAGLHIDHLCRVRACVNPRHMQPVTCRENILRGNSPVAMNAQKTHCTNGHEFNEANTYLRPDGGGRACVACRTERERRRGRRKKQRLLADTLAHLTAAGAPLARAVARMRAASLIGTSEEGAVTG